MLGFVPSNLSEVKPLLLSSRMHGFTKQTWQTPKPLQYLSSLRKDILISGKFHSLAPHLSLPHPTQALPHFPWHAYTFPYPASYGPLHVSSVRDHRPSWPFNWLNIPQQNPRGARDRLPATNVVTIEII